MGLKTPSIYQLHATVLLSGCLQQLGREYFALQAVFGISEVMLRISLMFEVEGLVDFDLQ